MVYRVTLARLLYSRGQINSLLTRRPNLLTQRTQKKSDINPAIPFLAKPSMFSMEVIKKHYGILPLFIIIGGGVAGLLFWIVRASLTRDDVRFIKNQKMACEVVELDPTKPPPIRKALVFNQKYEVPPGLIEALREPTEEELQKMQATKNKKKK